jgi:predicted benzoate:H+ symporter BenE
MMKNVASPEKILHNVAGWSSPVARRAHNPKAAGSNPAPATNLISGTKLLRTIMELWCSGLTCLPVTQEIAGSNPVSSAIFLSDSL